MNNYYAGPYELSFTKMNLRQPLRIYMLSLLTVFLGVVLVVPAFRTHPEMQFVPVLAVILAFAINFAPGLLIRITINDTGVHYQGLFSRKTLRWEEVASHGVVSKGRYVTRRLAPAQYDKFLLGGFKSFFVARQPQYLPRGFDFIAGGSSVIVFDYRRPALELVEYYLAQKNMRRSHP